MKSGSGLLCMFAMCKWELRVSCNYYYYYYYHYVVGVVVVIVQSLLLLLVTKGLLLPPPLHYSRRATLRSWLENKQRLHRPA